MALYEIIEFLTLSDVAKYLTDKCNYDFNLECSIDQNRLIETSVQLVRNDKLHPVFYYSGNADWLEKTVITRKSGSLITRGIGLSDITYNMSYKGYYFVDNKNFDKLIENNCSNYINVINCTVEPYHVDGKQEIIENSILSYRKIKEDFSINFHDLLYPKLDLDKLFNQTDTEVIEQLRKQVTDLEAENDQLNDKLSKQEYTPTDDKELPSNSQAGVARMLYAILTEHGYDLSPPKGKGLANDLIVNASNNHGTSVTRNFVADWLIRAREAKINNIK